MFQPLSNLLGIVNNNNNLRFIIFKTNHSALNTVNDIPVQQSVT